MNTENTYKIEYQRRFLILGLPETLTAADYHLQIFDNHIENTRIRLRKIRDPKTKEWKRLMEQFVSVKGESMSRVTVSRMRLTNSEYRVLEYFKGRETRKNRYFYEADGQQIEIDIFLGALWGLNMAVVNFETESESQAFITPDILLREVTDDEFFDGRLLVEKSFAQIQERLANSFEQ